MDKGPCAEYGVDFTERCHSDYQKLQKKMDAGVYGKIEAVFESLGSNPLLGHKLVGPLEGKRSASVHNHRVIYEINDTGCQVTIHAVGHHNRVYQDLVHYLKAHGLIRRRP